MGSGEPKPLSHRVKISGAQKPAHFYLRYYPQAVGEFYGAIYMHVHACMFEFPSILVIRYFSCQVPQQTRYCTLHLVNKQLLVGTISFCIIMCMYQYFVCVCLTSALNCVILVSFTFCSLYS